MTSWEFEEEFFNAQQQLHILSPYLNPSNKSGLKPLAKRGDREVHNTGFDCSCYRTTFCPHYAAKCKFFSRFDIFANCRQIVGKYIVASMRNLSFWNEKYNRNYNYNKDNIKLHLYTRVAQLPILVLVRQSIVYTLFDTLNLIKPSQKHCLV